MTQLGIVDIREIVRIIKENHNFDLSNFALTSLKYRLEKTFQKNGISTVEVFFNRLGAEPQFADMFIGQLMAPSTEMFRDPAVWRWLRDNIIKNLSSTELINFKIWLPHCVSGNELFTIAIILKECGILETTQIKCSYFSEYNLEKIKSGHYPIKKHEVSTENYNRFNGIANLAEYTTTKDNYIERDTSLLSNVEFIKTDLTYTKPPKNNKLIIFRNAMIYANPTLQAKMFEAAHQSLSVTGFLLIGINESLRQTSNDNFSFEPVNEGEKIYRKKQSNK